MDQTRSYAVEIDGYAQPQHRFAPLNAGLQSTVYAVHRTLWGVAIQEFDESSYLLPTPLYGWESVEQALVRAREQISKVSRRKYRERCMSMLFFKTVVGTATVKRVRTE